MNIANVLVILKCLRSMVGVTSKDKVRNGEMFRRVGMERELTSGVVPREIRVTHLDKR